MKRMYDTLLAGMLLAAPLFVSCEKDLSINPNPESRMAFVYKNTEDSLVSNSFAYYEDDVVIDTVWLDVMLYGTLEDYDRPIALEQVTTGENDAVPGKHYVAFDDAQLATYYKLPANQLETKLPIVLLRDASLKEENYTLKITFKPNEYFGQSVKERASRSVLIADQLVRPNNWDGTMEWFFGEYGTEKHFFLIQTFGGNWDDAYIEEEILAYYYTDQMVLMGMARRAGEALSELNAEREANGLGLLKEADGTVVEIPIF